MNRDSDKHPGRFLVQKLKNEDSDTLFFKYQEYLEFISGRTQRIQESKNAISTINGISHKDSVILFLENDHPKVIRNIRSQLFLEFDPKSVQDKSKIRVTKQIFDTEVDITEETFIKIREREDLIVKACFNTIKLDVYQQNLVDWHALEEEYNFQDKEIFHSYFQNSWDNFNAEAFQEYKTLYSYYFLKTDKFTEIEMDAYLSLLYVVSLDASIQDSIQRIQKEFQQKMKNVIPILENTNTETKKVRHEQNKKNGLQLPTEVKDFIIRFIEKFKTENPKADEKTLKYISQTFEESYIYSNGQEIDVVKRIIKLYPNKLSSEQIKVIANLKKKWEGILLTRKGKRTKSAKIKKNVQANPETKLQLHLQENSADKEILEFLKSQGYEIENEKILLEQFEKVFTSQPNKKQGFISFLNGKSGKTWQARPNGFFRINFGKKNAPHLISTRNGKITIVDFLTFEDYKKKYVENLYRTR